MPCAQGRRIIRGENRAPQAGLAGQAGRLDQVARRDVQVRGEQPGRPGLGHDRRAETGSPKQERRGAVRCRHRGSRTRYVPA